MGLCAIEDLPLLLLHHIAVLEEIPFDSRPWYRLWGAVHVLRSAFEEDPDFFYRVLSKTYIWSILSKTHIFWWILWSRTAFWAWALFGTSDPG